MTDDSSSSGFTRERLAAHAWAADLIGLPWPQRLRRVREDGAFAAPSFIELSISLGRDIGVSLFERQRWAQLAVEAAMRAPSHRAKRLEPLAWAVLGNAHRVRGRLSASGAAFTRCQALRYRMTDPLELADTFSLEASYWSAIAIWYSRSRWLSPRKHGQKTIATAAELVDEALRRATPFASDFTIGLLETKAGMIATEAGHWSAATTMLLSALDRIDPARHPRLALVAGQNLARTALNCGHVDTAMAGLHRLQGTYDLVSEEDLSLRHNWLMADVAEARGDLNEAERLVHSVRDGFIKNGMPWEVSLAEVEIARLAGTRGYRRSRV